MKPEKMKSLFEVKVRCVFPKNVKFHFGLLYYSVTFLSFQTNKNQIPKILAMWVFVVATNIDFGT